MRTAFKTTLVLIYFLSSNLLNAQYKNTDTLYIEYNKNVKIKEYTDTVNHYHIEISFSLFSPKDTKISTYNFKINNLFEDFEELKFNEIKDTLSKKEFKNIKITSIKELTEMYPCDLHFLLSEYKNIYLLKKKGETYFKYRLIYWSTQRGWETVNTH